MIATIFSGCFSEVRKQLPNGLDIFCTDADGVRTLEVTLAVNEALAIAGSVQLPLSTSLSRRRAV